MKNPTKLAVCPVRGPIGMTKLQTTRSWFRSTPQALAQVSLSTTVPSGAVTDAAWKENAAGEPPGSTLRHTCGGWPLPMRTCCATKTMPREQVSPRSRAGLSAVAGVAATTDARTGATILIMFFMLSLLGRGRAGAGKVVVAVVAGVVAPGE